MKTFQTWYVMLLAFSGLPVFIEVQAVKSIDRTAYETRLSSFYFRDKADGMRNVFRIGSEGVAGGLGPPRAWSK